MILFLWIVFGDLECKAKRKILVLTPVISLFSQDQKDRRSIGEDIPDPIPRRKS